MKLPKLLLLINYCLCFGFAARAQSTTDSLFNQLNTVLANKQFYVNKKQQEINRLSKQLMGAKTPAEKYNMYDALYEQYKSFSYDSAYMYAKKLQDISFQLNSPMLIASAKMKMAFTLLSSGLFKETFEKLNSINIQSLPANDKADYYFIKARSYFDLADYDRSHDYSDLYNPQGIKCIDSAMSFCKPGTFSFLEFKGLKDLQTADYNDGKSPYIALLNLPGLTRTSLVLTPVA